MINNTPIKNDELILTIRQLADFPNYEIGNLFHDIINNFINLFEEESIIRTTPIHYHKSRRG